MVNVKENFVHKVYFLCLMFEILKLKFLLLYIFFILKSPKIIKEIRLKNYWKKMFQNCASWLLEFEAYMFRISLKIQLMSKIMNWTCVLIMIPKERTYNANLYDSNVVVPLLKQPLSITYVTLFKSFFLCLHNNWLMY